ncbi:MAG TPA: NADH-quinone oxidoreductase subunit H, partial [Candidatus Dormibacteraeota bacterium]|nr:NADH-quinone oxidoreductase subunit H [Candidatus Dormibacteraeota bacterium]
MRSVTAAALGDGDGRGCEASDFLCGLGGRLHGLLPGGGGDVAIAVIKVVAVASFAMLNAAAMVFVWRRLMAFFQDRLGPNRVGFAGTLQVVADGIKLVLKEVIIPRRADRVMFLLAPVLVVVPFLLVYSVVPFGPTAAVADLGIGVLFVFAVTSLTFPGVFLAGWSSNSKYAVIGAMRAIAQLLAFAVPLLLSALGVVVLAGSLSLSRIVTAQENVWFVLPQALGAGVFLVAAMAENAAHPFDLPEAESEIVAGYSTEYSGMAFGLFYVAEFGTTFSIGAVFATLFLGGWR